MIIQYVRKDTTPLYKDVAGEAVLFDLLWGDRVELLSNDGGQVVQAKARGRRGYVKRADLGNKSLLEIYFIDVGQGDGVLIRTPDNRHLLIDGGYKRSAQPTGKNAADFVDWKFYRDYGMDHIALDALIASHCDADHYGGLWDLINPAETNELDLAEVRVKTFYHAGVSWWKEGTSGRGLGPTTDGYLTRLLGDEQSAASAIDANTLGPKLQGEWGKFIKCLVDMEAPIKRLSHASGYIPGFSPQDGAASLKVLGPVEFIRQGAPALRDLGSDSQSTNGNSILLRLDYGRTRTLLTGDLNANSQRALLASYNGQRQEFACDVAKGCHHGSDDCSYEFLSVLGAAATVISSGDSEGHAHPRPSIVAASAQTGHTRIKDDKVITPLVYSTEIARSLRVGKPYEVSSPNYPPPGGTMNVQLTNEHNPEVFYRETMAGALRPEKRMRKFNDLYVVGGVVYGLVNVRTDGNKILCATMNEKSGRWDVKTFESRF